MEFVQQLNYFITHYNNIMVCAVPKGSELEET